MDTKFEAQSARSKSPRPLIPIIVAVSALFLAAACSSVGKDPSGRADPKTPIPLAEDIRTGVLPNGLRYFLRPNAKPEGRAYLQLYVDAGSVLEDEDQRGLAHFVEHMAFNGTERFPKDDLVDYLRSLGMRFGPEVNAHTSYDETVYGIEVPTESAPEGGRAVPERALAVLDDWTRAISFEPKAVEDEKPVILEEYRMGLGAQDRIRKVILPAIFKGSAYAERDPIGLPEIVRGATAAKLAAFYRTWYRPDNMAIVIAGDFDADKLEAALAAHFTGPARPDKLVRPRPELPPPVKGSVSATIATDPELPYGTVRLYYKRSPEPVGADLAAFRQSIVDSLIDQMIGQRFHDATSVPETPYAAAGSSEARFGKTSRFFTMSAVPESGSTEPTLVALLREKESIMRFGFTDSELERAKAELLSGLEKDAAEKDKRESEDLANEAGRFFLDGTPSPSPQWALKTAKDMMAGIDAAAAAAACRALFADDDLTVLITANAKDAAGLPDEARVKELAAAAKNERLEAPKDAVSASKLLAEEPIPGSVVGERKNEKAGTVAWELSNGARVILVPTKNKNDEIILDALARGGMADEPVQDIVSASLATDLASASGVGPFRLPELSRMLAGKQLSLSVSSGYYTHEVSGKSTVADLSLMLQLLYLSFTEPTIDQKAAAAQLEGIKTSLARKKVNPEAVFFDTITRTKTGGHPLFEPLTEERLALLSLDSARAFLGRISNPGDFTFVFAGNADPAAVKPLVERYIASIPGKRTGSTWADPGVRRPEKADVVVNKGKENKGALYLGRHAPIPYSEKNVAAAKALEGYLDIVLTDEIREKRGDVYSIEAYAYQGIAPKGELALDIACSCPPEKTGEIADAVNAILAKLRDDGPDPAVWTKAMAALGKTFESSMQDNEFIASSIAYKTVVAGGGEETLFATPAVYASLTPEDVRKAMGALLENGELKVVLLPEAGTSPAK